MKLSKVVPGHDPGAVRKSQPPKLDYSNLFAKAKVIPSTVKVGSPTVVPTTNGSSTNGSGTNKNGSGTNKNGSSTNGSSTNGSGTNLTKGQKVNQWKKANRETIRFESSPGTKAMLKEQAAKRGMSVTKLVKAALRQYLSQ